MIYSKYNQAPEHHTFLTVESFTPSLTFCCNRYDQTKRQSISGIQEMRDTFDIQGIYKVTVCVLKRNDIMCCIFNAYLPFYR